MSDDNEKLRTVKEAEELEDLQLMEYLLQNWSLNSPEIEGIFTLSGNFLRLMSVTDLGGKSLEYPLKDLKNFQNLSKRGVYIPGQNRENYRNGQRIKARFELADKRERKKHENPLLLQVDPQTIKILTIIPEERIHKRPDGSISLEDTLCRSYIEDKRFDLISEIREIEAKVEELTSHTKSIKEHKDLLSKEIEAQKQQAKAIEEEAQSAQAELAEDFAKRKVDLENNFNLEVVQYQKIKDQYQRDNTKLLEQLEAIRSKYNIEDEKLRNQADALRDYVRSKADRLLQLEFITQEQVDALLFFNRPERDEIKEWPVLEDGPTPLSEAINHIQHYLYGKNIVYPLSLLQNFFALLSTGDLIILSGLSGSGKTNLVKSFADATGNVAHIIAVKPNWTSAEDLTGYYNPLQRSYLTTPFLDAILAAAKDPGHLHIICLDEMNLARVEYYFADFLSALEERTKNPTIPLYSDDEAGNVLCEFRLFVEVLLGINVGQEIENLSEFLKRSDVVVQMKAQLGLDDGESMLQLHGRLRRMLSGVLSVPSRLTIPSNVRFVGAVNMDDTTHFLSPKVLDRAHVLQFENPLMYWSQVIVEVGGAELPKTGIRIPAEAFPRRGEYPAFDPASKDELTEVILEWAKQYLTPIGIEIGVRTLRQSIHYKNQLSKMVSIDSVEKIALNNLLRQKLMPRLSFDGTKKPRGRAEVNCASVVDQFYQDVVERLPDLEVFNATRELEGLIDRAKANHNIFNYWS